MEHATTMNRADKTDPAYVLTVATKDNSKGTDKVWGNVQWASDKAATANITFGNDAALSTVTLDGAGHGTYVVIRLSDWGHTAYYAYVID